jgi:hypothetical protein
MERVADSRATKHEEAPRMWWHRATGGRDPGAISIDKISESGPERSISEPWA